MDVRKAVDTAEKDGRVRKLRGYFLGSCFACIKDRSDAISEWTLLYYNPQSGKAADCMVDEGSVRMLDESRTVNPVEKMDVRDASVGINHALEKVSVKFGKKTINILITLHHRARLLWTINMISADMNATTYDVDAKTGKILREETTSLVRRL